jgi:hypothetical protein
LKKVIVTVAVLIAAILLMMFVFFPSPQAVVSSATIPGTTLNSGDSAIIYRFAVSAKKDDVKIEQIYLTFNGEVSLSEPCLYDENGTELSGALYYNSEGKIRFWPGWPEGEKIVVPEGTTKVFSVRAKVVGQNAASIKLEEMELKSGSVRGLPAATITLTIK